MWACWNSSFSRSCPHHPCPVSEAVWRRNSSGVVFRNFCSEPAQWLLSLLTLQTFFLLTYLLTIGTRRSSSKKLFQATWCWIRLCHDDNDTSTDTQSNSTGEKGDTHLHSATTATTICCLSGAVFTEKSHVTASAAAQAHCHGLWPVAIQPYTALV